MIYEDKNIKVELKNKSMSQEEILAIMFWLMSVCGHEVDIALDKLEDEETYYDDLRG